MGFFLWALSCVGRGWRLPSVGFSGDFFCVLREINGDLMGAFVLWLSGYGFSPKVFHFSVLEEKRVGVFFMGELD